MLLLCGSFILPLLLANFDIAITVLPAYKHFLRLSAFFHYIKAFTERRHCLALGHHAAIGRVHLDTLGRNVGHCISYAIGYTCQLGSLDYPAEILPLTVLRCQIVLFRSHRDIQSPSTQTFIRIEIKNIYTIVHRRIQTITINNTGNSFKPLCRNL